MHLALATELPPCHAGDDNDDAGVAARQAPGGPESARSATVGYAAQLALQALTVVVERVDAEGTCCEACALAQHAECVRRHVHC